MGNDESFTVDAEPAHGGAKRPGGASISGTGCSGSESSVIMPANTAPGI